MIYDLDNLPVFCTVLYMEITVELPGPVLDASDHSLLGYEPESNPVYPQDKEGWAVMVETWHRLKGAVKTSFVVDDRGRFSVWALRNHWWLG